MTVSNTNNSRTDWLFYTLPVVILLACSGIEILLPGISTQIAGWPFLISLVLIGLPHGAADWAVSLKLHSTTNWGLGLLKFSGYLGFMVTMLALILFFPLMSLFVFAGISLWHFGRADQKDYQEQFGNHIFSKSNGFLFLLSRGGLILGLPLFLHSEESLFVVNRLLWTMGATISWTDSEPLFFGAGIIVLLSLTGTGFVLLQFCHKKTMRPFEMLLTETLVLGLTFWVLHPLFAMGIYFLTWHSWKHLRRLNLFLFGPSSISSWKNLWISLVSIHKQSLILLLPTLVIYGLLVLWRLPEWNPVDASVLTLAIFASVTLSHHLLIEKMMTK